jgi:hypothetical protein
MGAEDVSVIKEGIAVSVVTFVVSAVALLSLLLLQENKVTKTITPALNKSFVEKIPDLIRIDFYLYTFLIKRKILPGIVRDKFTCC